MSDRGGWTPHITTSVLDSSCCLGENEEDFEKRKKRKRRRKKEKEKEREEEEDKGLLI